MFIGRKKELDLIIKRTNRDAFEFGILYGRRRIGKTTLLKEVLMRTSGIYFVADEMGYSHNMRNLSQTVSDYFDEPIGFDSLDMLFAYLAKKSLHEKIVLVIDEFTYLFAKEPGIQSQLQNAIDNHLLNSNVTLILSGSHVGMIEDVISYHKPLYGRSTFRIKLEPFNYLESSCFYPNFSNEDKIRTYAVFGGIPFYLSLVDDKKTLKENIAELLLEDHAILAEETEFFLKQELRSISSYSMIIHAISSGATRLGEISTKARINNTGTTSKYVDTLRNLGIVEKEICFGENRKTKKTLYKIKDHFFDFHYKFIDPNQSKAILITPDHFYDLFIEPKLDDYVSFIFEQVAHEFLIRKNRQSTTNTFHELGRFWGNNHHLKREVELDVVTKDDLGIAVYECKWTTDLFRLKEVNELVETSEFLKPYRIGGFSKSGFSDEAISRLDDAFVLDDLFDIDF